jgi:hypothetical protein
MWRALRLSVAGLSHSTREHRRLGGRPPKLSTLGQFAVVFGPHPPFGSGRPPAGPGVFGKPLVDIRLPIAPINQWGVGALRLEFTDPLVAFEPTEAFLLLDRTMGIFVFTQTARLPRPVPGIQYAQAQALQGHRQGRMQVEPAARFLIQRPQPLHVTLAGIVQFNGLLNAQALWGVASAAGRCTDNAIGVRRKAIGLKI